MFDMRRGDEKVLIVEGDETRAQGISMALKAHGVKTVIASCVDDGLARAENEVFDLVAIDLFAPFRKTGLSHGGLIMISKMRQSHAEVCNDWWRNVPLVAFTSAQAAPGLFDPRVTLAKLGVNATIRRDLSPVIAAEVIDDMLSADATARRSYESAAKGGRVTASNA